MRHYGWDNVAKFDDIEESFYFYYSGLIILFFYGIVEELFQIIVKSWSKITF